MYTCCMVFVCLYAPYRWQCSKHAWCRKISSNVTAAHDIEQSVRAVKGRIHRCAPSAAPLAVTRLSLRHHTHGGDEVASFATTLYAGRGALDAPTNVRAVLDGARLTSLIHKFAHCSTSALCRRQQQDAERASLLAGAASTSGRSSDERDAATLGRVRQGRRGVEEMLDQAGAVLAGMGATRETLKVRACWSCTLGCMYVGCVALAAGCWACLVAVVAWAAARSCILKLPGLCVPQTAA